MAHLIWRGVDLGTIGETSPKAMAQIMLDSGMENAVYDIVEFFQYNYEDEPEAFFRMAVTEQFDGLRTSDFAEDMFIDLLECIESYGPDYSLLNDINMEVIE